MSKRPSLPVRTGRLSRMSQLGSLAAVWLVVSCQKVYATGDVVKAGIGSNKPLRQVTLIV